MWKKNRWNIELGRLMCTKRKEYKNSVTEMMRMWILKIIRTANGKENMYSNIQILGLLKGLDNSWCKKVIQHYQIFLFKFRIPCCGRTFQPWRVYSTAVWVGTQGQSCPTDASKEGIAQREVPSHSPGSFSSSVKDNSLILTVASWLDFIYALYQMKLCLKW